MCYAETKAKVTDPNRTESRMSQDVVLGLGCLKDILVETLRESELWRELRAWTRSFGGHQGGQEAEVTGMAELREVDMMRSWGLTLEEGPWWGPGTINTLVC